MERRQFTRIPFTTPAELRQLTLCLNCQLDDISLKGVLLDCAEHQRLDPEQPVLVNLTLPNSDPITIEGNISHQQGSQLGIHINLMDVDSASRLRRIVELNTGDDSLLKRELAAMLKT